MLASKAKSTSNLALLGICAVTLAGCSQGKSLNGFDLENASIPVGEIHRGGPPRDGIPSIDNPRFESLPSAAGWLRADDKVVGFMHKGTARAYPLRILVWHEIVNDSVAGKPIVVTYCPLCGTAMVFDAKVGGKVREFGVSGLLYNSDVLMYDRSSESLWSQLKMEAVAGPLRGKKLELLESEHTTFESWRERYPDGVVLSRNTGFSRDYSGNPYAGYADTERTIFPFTKNRDELPNKTWVAGAITPAGPVAVQFEDISDSRTITWEVTNKLTLELQHDPQTGRFTIHNAEIGERIPTTKSFWFAWQAFYPETKLWKPDSNK
jgi:hypothetical protein